MEPFFLYIYAMEITLEILNKTYRANLAHPHSIAIPMQHGAANPNAWYCENPRFEPVVMGDFVGAVAQGSSVNFRNVFFNPHGNGTHTESVQHISDLPISVNSCFKKFFFTAQLISVRPQQINGDAIVQAEDLLPFVQQPATEAIILRTLPNEENKKQARYSNQNPPYIAAEALQQLAQMGVQHFITDLPSVDREKDEGKLAAHKAFWQYPNDIRSHATITELAFIPNHLPDALYLLEMQVAAWENDAAPSRPVLYVLENTP